MPHLPVDRGAPVSIVSHVFAPGSVASARHDAGFAAAGQRVVVLASLPGDRYRVRYAVLDRDVAPPRLTRVELVVPASTLVPTVPGARRGDRSTSWQAARSQADRLRDRLLSVLDVHARHPEGLTDFRLAELTGIKQTSIGKRRHDLMEPGLIVDSGRTAFSDTQSSSIVWQITELGLDVWRTLSDAELGRVRRDMPTEGAA